MSQENVDLIRALYPSPTTDIVALFRNEQAFAQMQAALAPLLTDDFQSVMVFPGETRIYDGLEGMRRNWLDWLEPWATYRTAIDELIDAGDRVVLLLRDYGRRADMDIELEVIGGSICTVRVGKLARWEDYADRASALRAAGLS